ncbi:Cationic amino acid transporter 8, vacuolar [Hibiscus syriacus]|uniref:Cationic amino acid transporter 8, vacuolar n=1 Tax=Hibiscus syriacus TaxID=106335 RepID=A0A6A2ZJ94_HIBSY|nr:Cationic amino acid transporter 8, vacuolar [Hibiscus syriacus]
MTTSLLVGSLGQARYTTQIARAHMIPPIFSLVHPKTGIPVYATLLDVTPKNVLIKFLICLLIVIGSSIRVSGLWNSDERGWIGYTVAGLVWFSGTLGMAFLSKQRVPKVWGVPLVPWLPSLSIVMNLFLIGSLSLVAFLRFIICSAVMIVY